MNALFRAIFLPGVGTQRRFATCISRCAKVTNHGGKGLFSGWSDQSIRHHVHKSYRV